MSVTDIYKILGRNFYVSNKKQMSKSVQEYKYKWLIFFMKLLVTVCIWGTVGYTLYRFTLCTVIKRSTEDGYPHTDFGYWQEFNG